MVEEVVMPANLIPLDIMDFEVILGTYWLHYNRAKIDCYGKSVTSIVLDYQKLFLWVSKVEWGMLSFLLWEQRGYYKKVAKNT